MVIKRFVTAIVLGLAILATSYALLHQGFFRVHDYTHAARISEMTRALCDGHFPVRWSPNLGFGYGMPLFNFYAPLPYYVGSAFYMSGFNIINSIKLLYLFANILSIIGAYKMARLYFGRSGALLVAVFVGLAPYRALNLYVRGALSEAWGLAFIPWIIYSSVLLLRGYSRYIATFVLSLAGLALSHNISLIISIPILGIFVISEWVRQYIATKKIEFGRIAWLLWGSILAGLLAAFYLVPAFLEKDATKLDSYILDYYFNYHLHFLYIRQFFEHHWQYGGSGWGPIDDISFGLGYGQLAGAVLTLITATLLLFSQLKSKSTKILKSKWFWLVMGSGLGLLMSLAMTLEKTMVVWKSIGILKYLQFPWRWLTEAVVMLGVFGAIGAANLTNKRLRYLAVSTLIVITLVINQAYFKPLTYLDDPSDLYVTTPESIRGGMSGVLPDYIPKAIPKKPVPATDLIANRSSLADAQITVISDRVHEKLLTVTTTKPIELTWSVADFLGWTAEIDGKEIPKQVSIDGTIISQIPAGEHLVGLVLENTAVQYWSQVASFTGLVLLLATTGFVSKPSTVHEKK